MKSKCRVLEVVENYETYFIIKKRGRFFWHTLMEEDPYNSVLLRIKKFRYLEDAKIYVDKYIINLPAPKETIINEY